MWTYETSQIHPRYRAIGYDVTSTVRTPTINKKGLVDFCPWMNEKFSQMMMPHVAQNKVLSNAHVWHHECIKQLLPEGLHRTSWRLSRFAWAGMLSFGWSPSTLARRAVGVKSDVMSSNTNAA